MRVYQRVLSDASGARVRFNLMLDHWTMLDPIEHLGMAGRFGDRWLRASTIKFFIDGTEGQRTAKLSEPFSDDPGNTGMWMFPPEEFRERVARAHAAGWQCAVHAIGDAAVELTLDAFRDAQAAFPREDARHRVEHASLLRPDLVERFAREGVVPIPGARFASNDYPVLIERFGAERLRWYQPWNALLERNVPVAVSSDAPVQSPDPAKNFWAIVNSRSEFDRDFVMQPDERISLEETLLAYTRNGAFAFHEERNKGRLRGGMLGDVTIFDRNLSTVDALELDHVRVDATIVDGVVAFRRE
jgi:predicted amidohydrolase YtcJ